MIVSLNSKFSSDSCGGGINFANCLRDFLEKNGATVVNNLQRDNIDIILHINPFPFLMESASYSFLDAYIYKLKHPQTIIIQRINECDERKRTNYMNKLLSQASQYCDYIVFISQWLKDLFRDSDLNKDIPSQVILNGADQKIFNIQNRQFWNKQEKLKIVTHHWSGNYLKGHYIYKLSDKLLNDKKFADFFEFTYIGNYPKDLQYKNTKIIEPLSGKALAQELKKHHVYLTASQNEPAGMHHIEGALCGLPLLYINSGALPEYCNGFGIEFNEDNFEKKLWEMYKNYDFYLSKIKDYDRAADKTARQYYNLFQILYDQKNKKIIKTKSPKIKIICFKIYSYIFSQIWNVKRIIYFLKAKL